MAPINHTHTHKKKEEIIDTTFFNNRSVQTGGGHTFSFENTVLDSVRLLFLNWILATFIQRYDKNHFISRMRDKVKFYGLSGATIYDCINTIY